MRMAFIGFCDVPRANYLLRVLPPSMISTYARDYDAAICDCFCNIMSFSSLSCDYMAWWVATLPTRNGGLGLRSAERSMYGAYLVARIDSAAVIVQEVH